MKSYTDILQSRRLVEILPIESADMCYPKDAFEYRYAKEPVCHYNGIGLALPCWSLVGLLNVLPKPKVFYSTDKANRWYCGCWDSDGNFITFTKAGNPIDACYEMVIRLHKLNLL